LIGFDSICPAKNGSNFGGWFPWQATLARMAGVQNCVLGRARETPFHVLWDRRAVERVKRLFISAVDSTRFAN
jgi:hypothetical protein